MPSSFSDAPPDARYREPVSAVRAALQTGPGVVVLSGGVGAGKATVIAESLRNVPEANIVRVRGSRFGASTDYFALAHLLGDAVRQETSAVAAGAILHTRLGELGEALVVIAVTNWELLDSASVNLLIDALATGRYRAIIGCLNLSLDRDLLALVNAQIAVAVELPPLTSEQVAAAMVRRCGGIVSREVSDNILLAAAGDPLLVKFTIEQGIAQDWYVLRSGAWVRGLSSEWNTEVGLPRVHSLLATLSEDEHALLELVATFGSVATTVLVDLYRMESITMLEARGIITAIDRGRAYRFSSPIFAEIMRRSMTDGRFRAVWDLYVDLVAQPLHRNQPRQLLRVAHAGVAVDSEEIQAAAELASARRDHWLSDRLLDLLDDTAAVCLTRAANASMRGETEIALAEFARADARATSIRERADAIGLAFAVTLLQRFDLAGARDLLRVVESFPDDRGSSRAELLILGHVLELAYRGDSAQLVAEYEAGYGDDLHPSALRLLSRIYAEAIAVRGDAQRAAQVLTVNADTSVLGHEMWLPQTTAGARRRVLFLAGEWGAALELAQSDLEDGETTTPFRLGFTALNEAGLQVLRGDDASEALAASAGHLEDLETVLPGVRQALLTTVGGAVESDPVAELGDAVQLLESSALPRDEVRLPSLVAAFRIADLLAPADALVYLRQRMDAERARDANGVALVYAAFCLRVLAREPLDIGVTARDDALSAVQDLGAATTGELAVAVCTLAQALATPTHYGVSLVRDLSSALGLGTLLLPEIAGTASITLPIRSVASVHHALPDIAPTPEEPVNSADRELIAALTARERTVYSALLDGHSNADIAARFGITVRTAEGHVQRLYRLLGVNSRRALVDRFSTLPEDDAAVELSAVSE